MNITARITSTIVDQRVCDPSHRPLESDVVHPPRTAPTYRSRLALPLSIALALAASVGAQGEHQKDLDAARMRALAGAPAEAIAMARSLLRKDATSTAAWRVVAWASLRAGNVAEAEQAIARAIATAPEASDEALAVLVDAVRARSALERSIANAKAATDAERHGDAGRALVEAWRQERDDSGLAEQALVALEKAGLLEEAGILLREIEQGVPEIRIEDEPALHRTAMRVRADLAMAVAERLDAAREAIAREAWIEAEQALLNAERIDPNHDEVWSLLREVRNKLGRRAPPATPAFGGKGKKTPRRTADAIDAGLAWLAHHQEADGRWSAAGFARSCGPEPCNGAGDSCRDVWVTGLAVLAFLGDGHTYRNSKHRGLLLRAITWLRGQQDDEGVVGPRNHDAWLHDHAVATLALLETVGLAESLIAKPPARAAVAALQQRQLPSGAWPCGYGAQSDLATTLHATIGLIAHAEFDRTPNPDHSRTLAWLRSQMDAKGYAVSDPLPNGNCPPTDRLGRTAMLAFARMFAGDRAERDAARRQLGTFPLQDPEEPASWWVASMAMFQVGNKWNEWTRRLDRVIARQERAGHAIGSWLPQGDSAPSCGRVGATAMFLLALESHHRYSRLP